MVEQIVAALDGCASVLDCTLGGGGHSLALLEHGHRVTGIDRDPAALREAPPTVEINVVATVTTGTVEVRVADHGTWYGPVTDGGRGLQMIHESMDEVLFDRGDGTTVTMRRSLRGDR